jgi:hypothetical protein
MTHSLTILAHGKAAEVFNRHISLWTRLKPHIAFVISPFNDPLLNCPWPQARVGQAGHACDGSILRLMTMLQRLANIDTDYHIICEYDSFLLEPPVFRHGLTGTVFANRSERFSAPRYVNPPWMIDHQSTLRMRETAMQLPDLYEGGFADRYLSALAMISGVPILDWMPPGFSRATIKTPSELRLMRNAIKFGHARTIHGIKHKTTLDEAMNALP